MSGRRGSEGEAAPGQAGEVLRRRAYGGALTRDFGLRNMNAEPAVAIDKLGPLDLNASLYRTRRVVSYVE